MFFTHRTTKVKCPSSTEITFREFSALARRRGWTPESLAERFRGRVERPGEFFHRVLAGSHPNTLVPYQSIIDFFHAVNRGALPCSSSRSCVCGCGKAVFGRRKWATSGCKKRVARRNGTDRQSGYVRGIDFVEVTSDQNRATVPLVLPAHETGTTGV